MTAPVRLRLSRARSFDLQEHSEQTNGLGAVNVARPSIFGNPFIIGKDGTREECVHLYRSMVNGLFALGRTPSIDELKLTQAAIFGNIRRLQGKNLACWCQLDGKPCHADVLLEIASDPAKVAICDEIAGRMPPMCERTGP